MAQTPYGKVASVHESESALRTLFSEVEEYFDCGAVLAPGATVVDVGANIGAFAIAAAKRCEGRIRMFCFEPVPPLYEALSTNLRENDWLKGGEHAAHNMALSTPDEAGVPCDFYYFRRFPRDSTMDIVGKRREFEAFFAAQGKRIAGSVKFLGPIATLVEKGISIIPKGPVGQWLSDKATGLERLQVARDTLSNVMSKTSVSRIDLLKVDVEGAEGRVLAGIDASLWSKIQQVAIECDGLEETKARVIDAVRSGGLTDIRVFIPPSTEARGLPNVLVYGRR